MSVSRACQPCRRDKVKCDLQKPICGRCTKRRVACHGYSSDSAYVFLDENQTAKCNSRRARRDPSKANQKIALQVDASALETHELPSESSGVLLRQMTIHLRCKQALKTIPGPVMYKIEDRALEIFYAEWILSPCLHMECPGFLDLLPAINAKAAPESALSLAVDAFALANIRHFKTGNNDLTGLALSRYGAAIARIRRALMQHRLAADDSTLMSILIIDMFEVVFTVRAEPLAIHSTAIEHLLTARGTGQLTSTVGLALYRIANHRLQVRQFGLGHSPLPVQLACIELLNTATPSSSLAAIHIVAQSSLCECHELLFKAAIDSIDFTQVERIIRQIEFHIIELEQWKAALPDSWRPERSDTMAEQKILHILRTASLPFLPQVWEYRDPWIAHQMTFFYQGELALRASMINILTVAESLTADRDVAMGFRQAAALQEFMTSQSAETLVESIPPLIVSVQGANGGATDVIGKKITSCFARAICWTLQQGNFIPTRHKSYANQVEDWLRNVMYMG